MDRLHVLTRFGYSNWLLLSMIVITLLEVPSMFTYPSSIHSGNGGLKWLFSSRYKVVIEIGLASLSINNIYNEMDGLAYHSISARIPLILASDGPSDTLALVI
jgi:hypothetical protein